jgi:fructosamine-3-kinase
VIDALVGLLGPHTAVPVGGGDICSAYRVQTQTRRLFAKTPRRKDPHLLAVEAWGLRRIGAVVAGLTPHVVHVDEDWLLLEWVEQASPNRAAAASLGRRLASLHSAPAGAFGEGPDHGRIGWLPLPNGSFPAWAPMFAELRLRPLADGLPNTTALIDALAEQPDWAGSPEAPSLIHGDLWSGNILWPGVPQLVDPACHVGHRETDLAMLGLFGAPYLETIVASYQEVFALSPGWRERVALHQMWPLLVHNAMFGAAYGRRAEQIAAGYLRG